MAVVPFTTNTWYMFYDKSVFSEEDVKNLDTMLEKGTVSFPLINSWYLPAFYLGNGCTLFGDGTDESKGADFSGEISWKIQSIYMQTYDFERGRNSSDRVGLFKGTRGDTHPDYADVRLRFCK